MSCKSLVSNAMWKEWQKREDMEARESESLYYVENTEGRLKLNIKNIAVV